jgi:squalene synthase HpnC
MPVDHYENFPVASRILPRHLRLPVVAIYRFARTADDIADEGDAAPPTRLAQLAAYARRLDAIAQGAMPGDPIFGPLARAVREHALPIELLHDLLAAFRQDVVKVRYANVAELLAYCRLSANPVGRLLLHVFDEAQEPNLTHSDAICTGLQLVNHWQDVAIDWRKGRVYLPQDELERFGVTEAQIAAESADEHWRTLMRLQGKRARAMLESGAPLTRALSGRIGLELRLIVAGGARILDKIDAVDGDVFRHRPRLGLLDWPAMFAHALLGRP